jgi:3-hydroxymyristoyl/3-hydroxydecanoyl-(acyl carrier protein) dehydratase
MDAARLKFPATHPVFPGHFPGAPIVPGALLLAAAIDALGAGGPGLRIASAKFLRPVAPDEPVDVQRAGAGRLEFRVAGRLVASATLHVGDA